MVVMAPKDENELRHMLATALELNGPAAVRYPRGNGFGVPLDPNFKQLEIGKGEILREGSDIAILSLGSMVYPALSRRPSIWKLPGEFMQRSLTPASQNLSTKN